MIQVHNDATQDLINIKKIDNNGFMRLLAFIEQLRSDNRLISKLLDHGYGNDRDGPVSVKKWLSIQKFERQPVWRLRAWDLEKQGLKYRIIYLYYWRDQEYIILAIVHRNNLNYDKINDPTRQRVTECIRREFPDC